MHKYTLILSQQAERDLRLIWHYGVDTWGEDRAAQYLQAIEQVFVRLLEYPELGKKRPEVLAGCYAFPVGKHVVFYSFSEPTISILGILHQQMDIPKYLQGR